MKTQFALRDTNTIMNGFRAVIACGITEFPLEKEIPDEKIIISTMNFLEEDNALNPQLIIRNTDHIEVKDKWNENNNYLDYGFSSLLTSDIWRVPAIRGAFQQYFRKTNIEPSEDGLVVMSFTGILAVDQYDEINENDIFQFHSRHGDFYGIEGRIGHEIKKDWNKPNFKENMRGCPINMFLKKPTWGFKDEPVGMHSDLSLDMIEKMDLYRKYKIIGNIPDQLKDMFEKLEKDLQPTGLIYSYKEEDFIQFLIKKNEMGLLSSSAKPYTLKEYEEANEIATQIVKEVMEEKENSYRF